MIHDPWLLKGLFLSYSFFNKSCLYSQCFTISDAPSTSKDGSSVTPVGKGAKVRSADKDSDGEDDDDADDDDDDDEEETLESKIPKSHECKMVHGEKAITALTIDPSGSRLASG